MDTPHSSKADAIDHKPPHVASKSTSPHRWIKPLKSRKSDEPNRVATPLELLFDLVFVIAISIAGTELHHGLSVHHFAEVVPLYMMVFFAIWWAWMNFTWFASAYDNDDVIYRFITFVQIIGSLIIAAGIRQVFDQHDFSVVVLGYVIMRLGSVVQWLRAGLADSEHRKTAFRYAIGMTVVQFGWIFFQFKLVTTAELVFVTLVIAELLVPIWAEKANPTSWHPHHIAERYSLLTIIVLGESILASFTAVQVALNDQHTSIGKELICLMIGGMIIMFTIWWSYFDREAHHVLTSTRNVFIWGYGHFFIFISVAAVGAGLAVGVDVITGHAHINNLQAEYAIAIPLSIYSLVVWLIHDVQAYPGWRKILHPLTILFLLIIPLFKSIGYATLAMGLVYAFCIFLRPYFLVEPAQQHVTDNAVN